MKFMINIFCLIVVSLTSTFSQRLPKPPVPSTENIRGLKDTVGFTISAIQTGLVVKLCREAEQQNLTANAQKYKLTPATNFIAGISPHDDYIYAGPVYIHLFPYIKAKRIIIFGVSHYARNWNVENTLVFDAFKQWRGPYGYVQVSSVRHEILEKLPSSDYIISNPIEADEHSVEALIPWLQYFNRNVEIVSILAPYMRLGKLDSLASDLAAVLGEIIQKNNWQLGKDIAFLISNDCSHYGDQGWGGRNFAPFGADCQGLQKGTERDRRIANETLCGILSTDKVNDFYSRVLDPTDYLKYRIVWCGRYAIPFGTSTLVHLMHALQHKPLVGEYLRYGDSVELCELNVRHSGLGVTAPANLHHWVGYVAIGYK